MSRDRMYMILDLETAPDPAVPVRPRSDGEPRKGLPGRVHDRIVCAGVGFVELTENNRAVIDSRSMAIACEKPHDFDRTLRASFMSDVISDREGGEEALLRKLVDTMADADVDTVVTFNGRKFDLPQVAARCFRLGVPFPWYYDVGKGYGARFRSPRYRFSDDRHLDLCEWLSDHGAATMTGMDAWARAMGLPGKVGDVRADNVAETLAAGRQDDVELYCHADVWQTMGVLLRWLLVTTAITPAEYNSAAAGLYVHGMRSGPALAGLARMTQTQSFYVTDGEDRPLAHPFFEITGVQVSETAARDEKAEAVGFTGFEVASAQKGV